MGQPSTTAPNPAAVARSKQEAYDKLAILVQRAEPMIAKRLPSVIPANQMITDVMMCLQRTPLLLKCSPISVMGTIMAASEIGLRLNYLLGHAFMIPFWNGKTHQLEAQLQAGYKGLIALARRSGEISSLATELVYEFDPVFEVYYGTDRRIEHRPNQDPRRRGQRNEAGDLIGLVGAYATVRFKDSSTDFEHMNLQQLLDIRDRSQARDKQNPDLFVGPWTTDPGEMFRKVPIRRFAKRLPLTSDDNRFQRAAALDELGDTDAGQNNAQLIKGEPEFAGMLSELVRDQVADLAAKHLPQRQQPVAAPPPAPRQRAAQPRARRDQPQQPYRPSNADRSYNEHFATA